MLNKFKRKNISKLYYLLKPFVPKCLILFIRSIIARSKRKFYKNVWPIDRSSDKKPDSWLGWPDGKQFALLLTHDIETQEGYDRVWKLIDIDMKFGFKSCLNFIPKKYNVDVELLNYIRSIGYEIGVHGLYHDGKLFSSQKIFNERYPVINQYLSKWESCGFYAPSTLRNLDWIHNLDIEYDCSTFDTDPFEPQPDGMKTIFPFIVKKEGKKGYVEIPYTLPQDFTMFIMLKEKTIDIWKKKMEWVASTGGLVNVRIHPDYINFENKRKYGKYSVELYTEFLDYINTRYKGLFWNSLPKELCEFWKNR